MKRLWAPWRLAYIAGARKPDPKGCLFCRLRRSSTHSQDQIITRGRGAFSVLNRYPYNNGHLLVVPDRHVSRLEALSEEEWLDLFSLTKDALARLEKVFKPQGYNLGINLGRAAGAGIPGHLHLHIVPRWSGDVNFMPVIAGTRVISQSLACAHKLLTRSAASRSKKRKR